MKHLHSLVAALLITGSMSAHAAVPLLVNYQGKLSDSNGVPVTGNVTISVMAYTNMSGGTAVYTENIGLVAVTDGLYSFTWGDQSLLPHLLGAEQIWQELTIDSETMAPRQQLVAVPYALIAKTVEDGAITSEKLASGAVTAEAIADGAVTAGTIANGAVTSSSIANGAVGSAQIASNAIAEIGIADGSITQNKLAKQYLAGRVQITVSNVGFYYYNDDTPRLNYKPYSIPFDYTFDSNPILTVSYEKPSDLANYYLSSKLHLTTCSNFLVQLSCSFNDSLAGSSILDTNRKCGINLSSALFDHNPCLTYYDGHNETLKYLETHNMNASSWTTSWTSATIDSAKGAGYYSSLFSVSNQPAVCYYNKHTGELKYIRKNGTNITDWTAPLIIDTNNAGLYAATTTYRGNPAVFYYDETEDVMKYALIDDANSTTWHAPTNINLSGGGPVACVSYNDSLNIMYFNNNDGTLNYQQPWYAMNSPVLIDSETNSLLAMASIDDTPALLIRPQSGGSDYYSQQTNLLYKHANSLDGTNWDNSHSLSLNRSKSIRRAHPLKNVNSPAFFLYSYYYEHPSIHHDLSYIQATDSTGTNWHNEITMGSSSGYDLQSMDATSVSGIPCVAFIDRHYPPSTNIHFLAANDTNAASWQDTYVISVTNMSAWDVSLQAVASRPAMGFIGHLGKVCYIRALDAKGANWPAEPKLIYSSTNQTYYSSLNVLDGKPAMAFGCAGNIMLSQALDSEGNNWGEPVLLLTNCSPTDIRLMTSPNSMPVVTYKSNNKAYCLRAQNNTGTLWEENKHLGPASYMTHPSLMSNTLVTAFARDQDYSYSTYYTYEKFNVSEWTDPIVVATNAASSFAYESPNLLYFYDEANNNLMYYSSYNDAANSWNVKKSLATSSAEAPFSYLSASGNSLSYYNEGSHSLSYIGSVYGPSHSYNGTPSCTPRRITDDGNQGLYSSVEDLGYENPVIFYYDETDECLKYAHESEETDITVNWIAVEP